MFEVDTPEVKLFAGLYERALLTPEVISAATSDLNVP
jgi:hypothetical protein